MLTHPTTDRLRELGLAGMARALEEQRRHADAADLGFEDRLAMLVEREALERDSKRLTTRLRFAGLRQQATPEDVDHRAARGLDRALFQKLTGGEWIERHQDLLVTRPTGTGKTGCPAPWATEPAATTARCCITGCRGCWRPLAWRAATDATAGC
jgi:DNA replication protein DnaC